MRPPRPDPLRDFGHGLEYPARTIAERRAANAMRLYLKQMGAVQTPDGLWWLLDDNAALKLVELACEALGMDLHAEPDDEAV